MKKQLTILGLIGVIWAQSQLTITEPTPGSTPKSYQFTEITSATIRPDSIIFLLANGNS